ncbi:MAG: MMPL family transporter, partial [Bdellovibrionota bacterium]
MTRRAGWISLIGTLLAVLGGYFCVRLYEHLHTDIQELLPPDARSVVDLNEISRRLESYDSLAILVFTSDPKAGKQFVIDFAREAEKIPKTLLASVEYKIDRELDFFERRQALYLETKDLRRIRDYVRDRIDYEKELRNPLNIFSERNISEPQLQVEQLLTKYESRFSIYRQFPDGYYSTPDGTKRVVLLNLRGRTSEVTLDERLRNAASAIVQRLGPRSYSPDMVIRFAGGVEDQVEEHAALVKDLKSSSIIVALLVSIAMLLFYRNVRATLALVTSAFFGTLWTFGMSYFAVGYLNANSGFLGSIVLGNGINFGIIFLARYMEERRKGLSNVEAIAVSNSATSVSTMTAAFAAGLSYASLMLTSFRGFNQFGLIGLFGMVLCWASAFTVMPALLTLFERFGPLVKPDSKVPGHAVSNRIAKLVSRKA